MATCKECIHYDACKGTLDVVGLDIAAECPNQELLCGNFMGRNLSKNPTTNADRIRAMSDEELVKVVGRNTLCEYIQDNHPKHCEERGVCDGCIVDWLRKPVEEVTPNA